MILIGNDLIPYENISKIQKIEDIKHTQANSMLLFDYDEVLLKYCFENSLSYAVKVSNIKEAIFSNALETRYIISEIKTAKQIQKIADNYMFDSKNLAIIEDDEQIENIAQDEIDGVIYRRVL